MGDHLSIFRCLVVHGGYARVGKVAQNVHKREKSGIYQHVFVMQRHIIGCCQRLAKPLRCNTLAGVKHRPFLAGVMSSKLSSDYSTSPSPYQYLTIEADDKEGIATLSLGKKPVNNLNLEFLTEINIAFEKLETDKNIRGVIITSSLPNVFSAGLDLKELHQPKKERLETFWRAFQDVAVQIYGSSLAVVAAINGASPAGCMAITLASDYRVQAEGKYIQGLMEAQMGIPPPFWLKNMMQQLIGFRQTDLAVQRGLLFNPEQALRLGLVDKVVPVADVMSAARAEMGKLLAVPELGRILSKETMRMPFIEDFRKRRDEDLERVTSSINNTAMQKVLGEYLQQMAAKKSK